MGIKMLLTKCILSPTTTNEFTFEKSQYFSLSVNSVPDADACYMVSINVDNLSTNISLSETIKFILEHFFQAGLRGSWKLIARLAKHWWNPPSKVLLLFLMTNFSSKINAWVWVYP